MSVSAENGKISNVMNWLAVALPVWVMSIIIGAIMYAAYTKEIIGLWVVVLVSAWLFYVCVTYERRFGAMLRSGFQKSRWF